MAYNTKVKTELLLLHPPAYFDFRKEDKVYFPYMSTSGDVPITPAYDYFPLGFKSLKKYLNDRGHDTKILNLCTLMLVHPELNTDELFRDIEARAIGIDLHWMVHVQGSLEVASQLKRLKRDIPIIFGGISSTYYARELINYPFIDMVMKGYETHQPMDCLMSEIKGKRNYAVVPNLLWKNELGEVVENKHSYMPREYALEIDWSDIPQDTKSFFPISEILSTQNVGCKHDCGWCGGSKSAFKRIYGCEHSTGYKSMEKIKNEFDSIARIPGINKFNYYACGSYNESNERFESFLEQVKRCNFKSVDYEQFKLTDDNILKKMTNCNERTIITLSPESHNKRVSALAGRGNYSMDEMERWIDKAFLQGIYQIDIWFFVGMPEQDEKSVNETVEYCGSLLKRFKGKRVIPFICPMIPFLDPASNFFESPEKHGYYVHHKSVEEHRKAMKRASIINRMNYSTRRMDRESIVRISYKAIIRLNELKAEYGILPSKIIESTINKLNDALYFIDVVHEIDCIKEDKSRDFELKKISGEIFKRNKEVFFSGVSNQAFPIERKIGERWIDIF